VAHHNTDIFGSDVDVFRPERWLEEPEIVRKRDSYSMTVSESSALFSSDSLGAQDVI
jgi:hypothetical protein